MAKLFKLSTAETIIVQNKFLYFNLMKHNSTLKAVKLSQPRLRRKTHHIDDEISSEDDDSRCTSDFDDSSELNDETLDTKRRRMAKEYVAAFTDTDNIKEGNDGSWSDNDISGVLRKDRLKMQGKSLSQYSQSASNVVPNDVVSRNLNGHIGSVTSVVISSNEAQIFSASKDNSVILWDTETGQHRVIAPHWKKSIVSKSRSHNNEVLAVAISSDSKFLVSGGKDGIIRVYDQRLRHSEIRSFSGHRDSITCLAFQWDTYNLFSGSADRCIKHWDIAGMGYIETLFGHQDSVYSIDCWNKPRPVSTSGDRTVRLWKVSEESHLVYRGHKANIDCVSILSPDLFLSSGQDGSLNLWRESQKAPLCSVAAAHGYQDLNLGANIESQCGLRVSPKWISSLASIKMSDLAVTGSSDGFVNLWGVDMSDSASTQKIRHCASLPVCGFVNSLCVTPNLIVAGTGAEHRLGRWNHIHGNKNKIVVMRFSKALEDRNETL